MRHRVQAASGSFRQNPSFVIAGHSRPKDGVASLAYDPAIHGEAQRVAPVRCCPLHGLMDARVKRGHDGGE